jgi:maleylacetate reductase
LTEINEIAGSGWLTTAMQQTVAYGIPLAEALPEAVRRFSARRVTLVTTNSLSKPGGLAEMARGILGSKLHSVIDGMRPHTPRSQVIRVAEGLKGADAVVTIGGGSVCDSVKAARLCVANNVLTAAEMDRFRTYKDNPGGEGDSTVPPTLPFIAVPTTLSAAEFTAGAGVTDERGPVKQVFLYPRLGADIVILDPAMTLQTPPRLFFSTGIRAVDHAVESWCAINSNPLSDAYSFFAARLLIPSLRKVFVAPDDLQSRLDCMKGSWLSILGAASGSLKSGASHGIGHALGGTGGMPHGETSCVMLAHVLRYNASTNSDRQAVLASALGEADTPLADIIEGLVSSLELPHRLRDAGISEASLDAIAEVALTDPLVGTNPRPIKTVKEIRRLLQQAW